MFIYSDPLQLLLPLQLKLLKGKTSRQVNSIAFKLIYALLEKKGVPFKTEEKTNFWYMNCSYDWVRYKSFCGNYEFELKKVK